MPPLPAELLPPRWFPEPDRLRVFLQSLPTYISPASRQRLYHVLEFRDPRGYESWVIDLLREYNVALCVHDMPGSQAPLLTVGPIAYVRLHGYRAKYGGSYPDAVLSEWATWLERVLDSGRDAYVYFNNDLNGFAVTDATRLIAELDKRTNAGVLAGRSVATSAIGRSNA